MSQNHVYLPYGAFELKASYQKNMLIGNLSVLSVVIIIVSTFWIASLFKDKVIINVPPTIPLPVKITPNPLNPINPNRIRISGKSPSINSYAGVIPTIVADDVEVDNFQSEIITNDNPNLGIGNDNLIASEGGNGDGGTDGIYPDETEFVPFEKEPVMIYNKVPSYPRLCKLAGIEGVVGLKALIGINGSVVKAIIYKSSGNESLDEAALTAATENQFSPALQNSIPISLWVTYKVSFRLNN